MFDELLWGGIWLMALGTGLYLLSRLFKQLGKRDGSCQ